MTVDDTPAPALDPLAPGFFDDPYRQYAAVREADPVHRTPLGGWMLFRYDDVVRVLRDPSLSVEERHAHVPEGLVDPEVAALVAARGGDRGARAMLNLDPPDHHRLRRLVAKVFTPAAVEQMRPRVAHLVSEHLDAVADRDPFDVIDDLAFPLPFTVISEMLGMPEGQDRLELRAWSGAIVRTLEPISDLDTLRAAFDASDNMRAYLDDVLAYKRAHPDDRLLCALIAAEEEGDRLSPEELEAQVVLLFIAGHETTVNLIGNGVLALLRHRDQYERLVEDPSLDANAIEELLRYDSPVQMSRRIATTDLEIAGHPIEAGSFVLTCLGSANRDPLHWGDDADVLDLARPDAASHMSFGGGVHHCLGNHLARLEGQEAIGALVRRFPRLTLATDALEWNGRIVLRGLRALPVTAR